VQQSRGGFQKMRRYFSAVVHQKMTERSHKIKLPSQQKSRSPHQASLYARNKAAATFETCAFSVSRSLRLCCTRTMKLGADHGFFVDRTVFIFVTSRLFCLERPH
jgi:hypothetical protein